MVFLNLQIQDIIAGLEAAGWNPSALPPDAIVTFSATAPTTPSDAQLWFSSITNVLSIWNGTEWQAISLTAEQEALALDLVTNGHYNKNQLDNLLTAKQNVLVSGVGIKTVNSQSLLGSGDISISATVSTLDAIGDVNLPTQTAQDYLYFDGAQWTSKQHSIDTLTNVTTSNPLNGQALIYNSTTLDWENQTLPSGITDHTLLSNIGTNTHAQIDTALSRLANTSGTNTGDQDLSGYALTTHTHTGIYEPANVNIQSHISSTSNPHSVTASQVGALPLTGGTMTGNILNLTEASVNMASSVNFDLSTGNIFYKTITGSTVFTKTNVPISGKTVGFTLELTNGGSAALTWTSLGTVTWAGGTIPTFTTSGLDIIELYTRDGGTTWRAFLAAKDIK